MSHRRNIKALCLALVAVFAFGAIAAGAAQATKEAPVWTVGGVTIGPAVSKSFTAKSVGAMTLDTKVGFSLSSTSCFVTGSIVGSVEGSPGTNKEVVFTCTGVVIEGISPEICQVHSTGQANGTIKTESLASTLVWLKSEGDTEVGDLFKGVGENEKLFELEITGASCPLKGNYPVTGTFIGKVEPVTSDVTTITLNFPSPPIETYFDNKTPRVDFTAELKVKALTASLTGKASVTLTSDELWGVELG